MTFQVVLPERYNLTTYDDDDGTGRNNKMIITKNSILKSYLAIKDTKKGLFAIFLTIMIVLVVKFVCFSCWSYFCLTCAAFYTRLTRSEQLRKYYHEKITGHMVAEQIPFYMFMINFEYLNILYLKKVKLVVHLHRLIHKHYDIQAFSSPS